MRSLLFLCHRIPFPPDKGEKIRAFRILEHLRSRYRVHLGCFIDDPDDWAHVRTLESLCAEVKCVGLPRRVSRMRAATGLLSGAPLSVASFADAGMHAWVGSVLDRNQPEAVLVYSSAMAQFIVNRDIGKAKVVIDFVDVDSDKFRQYADDSRPPMSWVYALEAKRLLAFDRTAAVRADANIFVSDAEVALFRTLAPESGAKTLAVANGIDCEFFSPKHRFETPFKKAGPAFVFTGTMDYRPNVDAVTWFAREIFPRLRARAAQASFTVVGAKPSREVSVLAEDPAITVTGRVPDVRPYLAHADVVVAPLRMARGIQNKILEGMAMARPVVTTGQGLEGIEAQPGVHLLVSDTAAGFADASLAALQAPKLGPAARALMESCYAWSSRLSVLDDLL